MNQAAFAPTTVEWTEIRGEGGLSDEKPAVDRLDGEPLGAVEREAGPAALFARCSYLGGPLDEGDLVDGSVRCPWHGSQFRPGAGAVVRSPATAPQPAYEVRLDRARALAGRRPPA